MGDDRVSQWLDGTGTLLTRQPSVILPSVSIVLDNGHSQVLLHQRADNGWWALPGGAIDIGESVTHAACRELEEETGYALRPECLRLTGIYSDPETAYACSTYVDRTVHYVCVTFRATYLGDEEPQASPESVQIGWHRIITLPKPMMPSHALRIEDAIHMMIEGRKYPFVR